MENEEEERPDSSFFVESCENGDPNVGDWKSVLFMILHYYVLGL